MATQKQYFEAKDELYSKIINLGEEKELDSFEIISLLSSITAEFADSKRTLQQKEKANVNSHLIGKKVKVNVGNDTWGEIVNTDIPHLVTCEVEGAYGLSVLYDGVTETELLEKKAHQFIVKKVDVELWEELNVFYLFVGNLPGVKIIAPTIIDAYEQSLKYYNFRNIEKLNESDTSIFFNVDLDNLKHRCSVADKSVVDENEL